MITDQKSNGKIVGVYVIGDLIDGTQIGVPYKPNALRKFFTWLFMGWKWYSIPKLKEELEKIKNQ
jgi:hypothetical protein